MKRNLIEDLKTWGEGERRPFFLYGIEGVGKTWLVNNYVTDFCEAGIYFKTEPGSAYYADFLTSDDPLSFVAEHFHISQEALDSSVVIFDDADNYIASASKLLDHAVKNCCKWIFAAAYDFVPGDLKEKTTIRHLTPLQFDEFLIAAGSEWYVEAVKTHFKSRKKMPDIVHEELLSDFEEYLWVGGMPEVVNDYLTTKSSVNITKKQERAKLCAYHAIDMLSEETLRTKCRQILGVLEAELLKPNQKFMFGMIRNGVTYKMYADAISELEKRGLAIRQFELNDEKKFKIFYPEYSFFSSSKSDEVTDVEYGLRTQNYILQTLNEKGIDNYFWESGNRAELPVVIKENAVKLPVDVSQGRNLSRSIASFLKTENSDNVLRITEDNFMSEEGRDTVPVYAIFCL